MDPAEPDVPSGPLPKGVGPARRSRMPMAVRLWVLFVVLDAAGMAVAIWVARLIRAVPVSETVEQGLRLGYFAAMLVVGVIGGLLVDELLFRGGFRRTHLQGRTARYLPADAEPAEVAATLQRSSVGFPFVLLGCTVLAYLQFNWVNHDFDVYYRRIGRHVSALRGDAPERAPARLEALANLSIRRDPEILPVLRAQLERTGEVAAWAAWALGRHYDLPRRRVLFPPLVAAARRGDTALRREALVALGRLQHRASVEELLAELGADLDAGGPVDLRLLYALGVVQHMSAVPLLQRTLHGADEDAQRAAAWALAQHRDQRGGRATVGILEERLPTASIAVRCAVVHALGILADEASNLALVDAYERASPEDHVAICNSLRIAMRPDGRDDFVDLLVPQESFSLKIMRSMAQMRATTPEIRTRVEPWLEGVIAAESSTAGAREAGAALLKGIREGRDDTGLKTADEAIDEAFGPR